MTIRDLFSTISFTQRFEIWFEGKKVYKTSIIANINLLHPRDLINLNFDLEIDYIYTQVFKFKNEGYQAILLIDMKDWRTL